MGERNDKLGVVLCVVGARPNFMKMAPILRAFALQSAAPNAVLVHTGQHYDEQMSERLFKDLALPMPDVNLEVGSATHALQTAEIMRRFEPVVDSYKPSCVMVVGDVNSTIACGLVAAKKGIPVAHVEAGLRSFDRAMPEEINRVLTDQISDVLYTTERTARDNLVREGIDPSRIEFVGNVMIDSLRAHRARAIPPREVLSRAGIEAQWLVDGARYGVVTLHRPSNVDNASALTEIIGVLGEVAERMPLICALHPRTRGNLERFGLVARLKRESIVVLPPQGYLEMLGLMGSAQVVLTDSGGIQEETTALSVPCLTMRENTERPITVEQGTNTLVGRNRELILRCVEELIGTGGKRGRVPEYWDGNAASRIVSHLSAWLAARRTVYAN
jgi:UDP-N-acetylglucosamine 2-epimerase (non-hydrolysing)